MISKGAFSDKRKLFFYITKKESKRRRIYGCRNDHTLRRCGGGVASAGGHILRIGARAELSDYLGVDTEVVEYHNSTLFTFDRTNTEGDANIAVVAGNMKHHGHGDLKKTVGLRFLMYHGDVVIQKEL